VRTGTPHGVLDPMLPAHELARLCERLGLSVEAKVLVESIRSSPPTRRVRSAAGNVSVRYPSRKMGVTIQAESHHVELAALYEYEHDPRTLEFYDQPAPIKLVYAAKNGRRLGGWLKPALPTCARPTAATPSWRRTSRACASWTLRRRPAPFGIGWHAGGRPNWSTAVASLGSCHG
jgi:hypothetical protein